MGWTWIYPDKAQGEDQIPNGWMLWTETWKWWDWEKRWGMTEDDGEEPSMTIATMMGRARGKKTLPQTETWCSQQSGDTSECWLCSCSCSVRTQQIHPCSSVYPSCSESNHRKLYTHIIVFIFTQYLSTRINKNIGLTTLLWLFKHTGYTKINMKIPFFDVWYSHQNRIRANHTSNGNVPVLRCFRIECQKFLTYHLNDDLDLPPGRPSPTSMMTFTYLKDDLHLTTGWPSPTTSTTFTSLQCDLHLPPGTTLTHLQHDLDLPRGRPWHTSTTTLTHLNDDDLDLPPARPSPTSSATLTYLHDDLDPSQWRRHWPTSSTTFTYLQCHLDIPPRRPWPTSIQHDLDLPPVRPSSLVGTERSSPPRPRRRSYRSVGRCHRASGWACRGCRSSRRRRWSSPSCRSGRTDAHALPTASTRSTFAATQRTIDGVLII